ncbi:hypothetical protein Prubr_63200 [Polymorphospora rubra]|uniref:Uncharacterized protein n=1 Tax=Polymorphospora rubra TaxID=338584 RepID=A0A810NB29_9ACTN|nr:hypothetical protein Prubr_63200 [Polymorphospora rubra]
MDAAARIVLVTEQLVKPHGVVGVLHGRLRPGGRDAGAAGAVAVGEVEQERGRRPGVVRDVVHDEDENVVVEGEGEQPRVQGWLPAEVERVGCHLGYGLGERALTDLVDGQLAQGGDVVDDLLVRYAAGRRKDGAQALVASGDIAQGSG